MKRKKVILTFLIVAIGWHFFSGLKAYYFLLFFHLNSSTLSDARKNFHLRQVMGSATDMNWTCAEDYIINKLKPQGGSIVSSRFQRGVCLPTGQMILEFLTVDRDKEGTSGYLDIIYAQKAGEEYQRVGYFRKFLP